MSSDLEEQQDELVALLSIFDSDEFVRSKSKSAGELRVSVELPKDFDVALKEGDTLSQYEISFLPPLLLTFDLPEDYPSCSAPSFSLSCPWLTQTQLSSLAAQLNDLYQSTGGTVVLFSWVQFLKDETLSFLGIHNVLDIPSDGQTKTPESTEHTSEEPLKHEVSLNKDDQKTKSLSKAGNDDELISQSKNYLSLEKKSAKEASLSDCASPTSMSSLTQSQNDGEATNAAKIKPQTPLSSLSPGQALMSQLLIYDAAQKEKAFSTSVFDCGVCFMSWLGSECVQLLECAHVFCRTCLTEFCKLQIINGNIREVTCPQADCQSTPTPAQVRSLVGEELFSRYDRLLLQSTLDCMPDVVYCPRPSCASAVLTEETSPMALCTVCSFAFCALCKKTYHGTEDCQSERKRCTGAKGQQPLADIPATQEGMKALWDDYTSGSRNRQQLLESRYGRTNLLVVMEDCLSEDWITFNSKNCPYCFSRIQKNGGCNRMVCFQCRRPFCWACLAKTPSSDHFQFSCTLYEHPS